MNRKYGYIKSPKDLRDYKINRAYTEELPDKFEVPHTKIKDQGDVGSCVAHAVSEVLESQKGIDYSTAWIYGYRPSDYYQGEGMVPQEALKTINKVGYIKTTILPGNFEIPKAKQIVDDKLDKYINEANKKKIISYARLKSISDIKHAIYKIKKPILLAIEIGEQGLELENNIALIPEVYDGGHQMICYGWNKDGFLIQNSWGKEWGNEGTFILPYEYPISESWAIYMYDEEEKQNIIIKPKAYKLRELIEFLIKSIKEMLKRK